MRLPPLNPLKAFEATVRLGGFTAASVELGVSPPAVSMQVRKAEEYFGKKLFLRTHNELHLTDAGRQLYPSISEALTEISTISDHLLENDARSSLVLSTIQSLSVQWVAPGLARFRKEFPDIGVELRIETDPVDLTRSHIDVRLTYENHLYPQLVATPLFGDVVYPMCSKEFAKDHLVDGDLNLVSDSHFIHTDWGESYASYPTWAAWFREAKSARNPDPRKGLRVGGTAVAAAVAAGGGGIALVPSHLFQDELHQQQLISASAIGLPLPYSFFAITQQAPDTGSANSTAKSRAVSSLLHALQSSQL
jgi:LysR family transcriptional regulator, glycine cleavage system transcriptional activator